MSVLCCIVRETPYRNEISNVSLYTCEQPVQVYSMRVTHEVIDVAMLFELCSGELSHVFSCSCFRYVRGAADNLPPEGQCTLSLNKLWHSEHSHALKASRQRKAYMIKSDRALPSCSQPGGRLRCYRGISTQHSRTIFYDGFFK
jgi:hypothetical protein